MAQPKNILGAILELINNFEIGDLDRYLKNDVEWESVGDILIIPQQARKFIKSIQDKEARIAVARFLHKYARQYFREVAEAMENKERSENFMAVGPNIPIKTAEERIALFQQELAFLLDQDESTGEFSGDKFHKQERRIAQLEEENNEYKKANKYLQEQVDRYENPHKYGRFIPAELNNRKFANIMRYLQMKQLVLPLYPEKDYTRGISCYQWYGSCALFGYFVWKLNQEFELNEARELLNWHVFETAINNYGKLIKEARKAVSKFRKDDKVLLPAKADYVDDAIKNANGEG